MIIYKSLSHPIIQYELNVFDIHYRFRRFTAIAPCSILALGCIILAFLRLKSWYILKIKNQPSIEQPSLGNNYNTQGKNPIIFNVKGLLNFIEVMLQIYNP